MIQANAGKPIFRPLTQEWNSRSPTYLGDVWEPVMSNYEWERKLNQANNKLEALPSAESASSSTLFSTGAQQNIRSNHGKPLSSQLPSISRRVPRFSKQSAANTATTGHKQQTSAQGGEEPYSPPSKRSSVASTTSSAAAGDPLNVEDTELLQKQSLVLPTDSEVSSIKPAVAMETMAEKTASGKTAVQAEAIVVDAKATADAEAEPEAEAQTEARAEAAPEEAAEVTVTMEAASKDTAEIMVFEAEAGVAPEVEAGMAPEAAAEAAIVGVADTMVTPETSAMMAADATAAKEVGADVAPQGDA